MKLWQKEYKLNKEIETFTVGDDFILDQKLIKQDVFGSIAHAKMLYKIGILSKTELKKLKKTLLQILSLEKQDKFKIEREDEDVHTAIENFLTKKLGKTGGKIHTARSRNDQVLVDLRLYTKEKLLEIEPELLGLCKTLLKFSKENKTVPMPGYTHMQKAMPSTVALWSTSFIEALLDDLSLVKKAYELNDQCPLGSGASYGVSLNIDRKLTSDLLGFAKVQKNVLYVQNSRGKIEAVVLSSLVQVMQDLAKLASDILLFTTSEFNFFKVPKEFCTGSSIMPQKKNVDIMELVRAKSSIMNSYLFQVINIANALPSGYNRDFQLTKEPLIEGLDLAISTLKICNLFMQGLKANQAVLEEACTPEIFATDEAYKLVKQGLPFREAYQKIAADIKSLKKLDIKTNIKMRKHLGATGNLNLKKIEKTILIEQGKLNSKKSKFEKKIAQIGN